VSGKEAPFSDKPEAVAPGDPARWSVAILVRKLSICPKLIVPLQIDLAIRGGQ
jgi:hypothetical protein